MTKGESYGPSRATILLLSYTESVNSPRPDGPWGMQMDTHHLSAPYPPQPPQTTVAIADATDISINRYHLNVKDRGYLSNYDNWSSRPQGSFVNLQFQLSNYP